MIERALPSDSDEIFTLHIENINKSFAGHYPQEVIDVLIEGRTADAFKPIIQNEAFYCLKINNVIQGFVHFNDNELLALYLKFSQIGKGYGKKLFNFAVSKIETRPIKIVSTLQAVPFYKKNGLPTSRTVIHY